MLSDDDLAKIAYAEMMRGRVGAELGWIFRAPDEQVRWIGIARAVRAALAREHDAEWDALNREIADLAAIVHGTSDAERALAVLDRLLRRPWPTNEVRLWRGLGGSYTACIHRLPDAVATGPTPAAALLALGARLEGQNGPERDEGGA